MISHLFIFVEINFCVLKGNSEIHKIYNPQKFRTVQYLKMYSHMCTHQHIVQRVFVGINFEILLHLFCNYNYLLSTKGSHLHLKKIFEFLKFIIIVM